MPTPRAEIIGRCVKEPYKGTDKKGNPYLFVRVATSDSHKDGDEWITDRQLFVDVRLFNADPGMRIPEVGDTVRAFGPIYENVREREGKSYKDILCRAEYLRSVPKRQQGGGGSGWPSATGQTGGRQAGSGSDPWGEAGVPPEPSFGDAEPPF